METAYLFKWHDVTWTEGSNAADEPWKTGTKGWLDFWKKFGISYEHECPWCSFSLKKDEKEELLFLPDAVAPHTQARMRLSQCAACGWYSAWKSCYSYWFHMDGGRQAHQAILKKFPVDDEQNVSLRELGSFLRKSFRDVYSLRPRRLEELIADIFRNVGYEPILTQETCDGGADVILLERTGRKSIVEVKRYREDRTIGVGLVRQLIGAQILNRASKSYFVTTSTFSTPAKEAVEELTSMAEGLRMELWDGMRLLSELDCYNEAVLPVSAIDCRRPIWEQLSPDRKPRELSLAEVFSSGSNGPPNPGPQADS